MNTDKYI